MSSDAMILEKVTCRCSAERIRGDSCPYCGFHPKSGDPMEINHHVVRRRKIAQRVDELVEQQLAEKAEAPEFWELVYRIGDEKNDWFNQVLTPFLVKDPPLDVAEPLADFIAQVERARKSLQPLASLRPHADLRAQLKVLDQIATWWPIYRTVATTTDRALIAAKSEEGQKAVDTALDAVTALRPVLDALEALDTYDAETSLTSRQVRALTTMHPEMSLQEIASVGAKKVEALVGRPVSPELGLQHLMLDVLAHGALSPEAFATKLSEVADLWRGKQARAQQIAEMVDSVERLADVSVEISELFVAFDRAVKDANTPGAIVRAAKRLFGLLYEEAQPLWIWARLLAEENRTSAEAYWALTESFSTSNVSELKDVLPTTCSDAEGFYRNATHHNNGVVWNSSSNQVVVTTLKDGSRHLTLSEFVDRVYGLVESVLALHWGAQMFLTHYDIELPTRSDMPTGFGFGVEDEAYWYFEVRRGVPIHRNEVVDSVWHMEAEIAPKELLTAAVLLSLKARHGIDEIRLSCPGQQNTLLEVDPAYVHALMSTPSPDEEGSIEERLLRVLKCRAASSLDGKSLLSKSNLEYAAVAFGLFLLSEKEPSSERVGRLRTAMKWAESSGHESIADKCRTTISVWRGSDQTAKYLEMLELQKQLGCVVEPEMPAPSGVRLRTGKEYPSA